MYRENARCYEVLGYNGEFKPFTAMRTIEKQGYAIIFTSTGQLKCSLNHRVMTLNDGFKYASELSIEDSVLMQGENSSVYVPILDITFNTTDVCEFYDIVGVEDHVYYTNNILSHNCDFLGSGDNVIDPRILRERANDVRGPMRVGGFDGNVWYWVNPEPNRKYFICADVARGDATDFSAAHVLDIETGEQCAEYKAKLPPDLFATVLEQLGAEYNTALIAVEVNNAGIATCLQLIKDGYPNIFRSMPSHFNSVNRRKIQEDFIDEDKLVPGFTTTSVTRPLLVAALERAIRERTLVFHSSRTYNELQTFIWINGKPQAMGGYNDDLCMSMGIGQLIMSTSLKLQQNSKDMDIAILDAYTYSIRSNTDPRLNVSLPESTVKSEWVRQTGNNNEVEDLKWLLGR